MSERKQTIRRANHTTDPFYRAARATAQDKDISYDALGMMNYLLSKPDNWVIQPMDLVRHLCKRDKVYKILRELIDAGYVERIIHRDSKGRTTEVEYILHELKHPLPENPDMDKPDMENTDSTYKREEHTKDSAANAAQGEKRKAKATPRKRNLLFDAVATHIFQFSGTVNPTAGGHVAKVVSAIRQCGEGVPDAELASEVRQFVEWYRVRYPQMDIPISDVKIAVHWQSWKESAKDGGAKSEWRLRAEAELRRNPVRLFKG